MTGDVCCVPSSVARLQDMCAQRGGAWDVSNLYTDIPLLGAACRWFDIYDTRWAHRCLTALKRHYVLVFVQKHHKVRRFERDEGTSLGSIGDLADSSVEECTLRNIATTERDAIHALRWLKDVGAIDVRALSLSDHEYYLVPASIAGMLRALLGRCPESCCNYQNPVTDSFVEGGTCGCDVALKGLKGSVSASLRK